MARGQRDPVREQLWRKRIADWQSSQLSIRAFCRQHDLAETAFQYWRQEWKLRCAAQSPSPASSPRPTFVPITVLPNPEPVSPEPRPTETIEVRCPSGHVVLVPLDEETITLRHLFAALAAHPTRTGEEASC